MALILSGCTSSSSRLTDADRQSVDVSQALIVDSKNVTIKNVLQEGKILAGKNLNSEDVSDSFDLTVPVSDFLNAKSLGAGGGAPIHVKIPKSSGSSERLNLALIQEINASHIVISNSSGIDIGNTASTGGAESSGTVVTKITGTIPDHGSNAPVSGLALPKDNVFLNQQAAEQKASQMSNAPVMKAQAVDPNSNTTVPAWIPIPQKLLGK